MARIRHCFWGIRLAPDRERFLKTIHNFWFEAYCVTRVLSRRDLWFAKRIEDSNIKNRLYRMALWQHQAAKGWKPDPLLHMEGKRFEKWASPELIEAVGRCFSLYDVESTWNSLFAMVEVFGWLAQQTSIQLRVEFPERVEQEVLDYLDYLRDRGK